MGAWYSSPHSKALRAAVESLFKLDITHDIWPLPQFHSENLTSKQSNIDEAGTIPPHRVVFAAGDRLSRRQSPPPKSGQRKAEGLSRGNQSQSND